MEVIALFKVPVFAFLEVNDDLGGRMFGLDIQTIFSVGINLFHVLVLALVLSFILYRPVRDLMRKRTEKIEGQLSDAAVSLENANNMKAEYEQKLSNVEVERVRILEAAHKQADDTSKRIIDNAKSEAKAVLERAEKDVKSEMARLSDEVRLHIIEVASLMAGKFVENSINDNDKEKLYNDALNELEKLTWPS